MISYVIRKMQIKTTMRYHYTWLEWPKSGTLTTAHVVRMWSNRNSHIFLVGMKNSTATLEDSLVVSYKTKHTLTIWSSKHATRYLCTQRTETYVNRKTCTWMFIADLFINAKTWKQPRCSSVGKWIYKLWYIQTMEFHSALKRNELSICEKTWRNLKTILLGFPGGAVVENLPANAGNTGSSPGLGRSHMPRSN